MNKNFNPIALIILTANTLFFSKAGAQEIIYDNPNYGQLERMSATDWNNWKPDPGTDWLGIPDNFEGWFFWDVLNHSYYTGPDLRPLKADGPYTLNIASTQAQNAEDKAHTADIDTINNISLSEFSNMSGGTLDIIYITYYSDVFSDLANQHTLMLAQLPTATQEYLTTSKIEAQYLAKAAVIQERISAVHDAYMQRGSRMLAYIRLENEWTAMLQTYALTIKQVKIYLSHKK